MTCCWLQNAARGGKELGSASSTRDGIARTGCSPGMQNHKWPQNNSEEGCLVLSVPLQPRLQHAARESLLRASKHRQHAAIHQDRHRLTWTCPPQRMHQRLHVSDCFTNHTTLTLKRKNKLIGICSFLFLSRLLSEEKEQRTYRNFPLNFFFVLL